MEPTQISLPWMEVLKLALSTGAVAAVLNQGISWLRDWRKETKNIAREGRYLALRLAVILERFSINCAELIASSNLHDQTDGNAGKKPRALPPLAEYPSDADWKSLDSSLCAKALEFRNELELSGKAISFWGEVDHMNISSAFMEEAGKCGYRAWKTANDLRKFYDLPIFRSEDIHWDFVGTLIENHDKAIKRLAEA